MLMLLRVNKKNSSLKLHEIKNFIATTPKILRKRWNYSNFIGYFL